MKKTMKEKLHKRKETGGDYKANQIREKKARERNLKEEH